LKNYSRNHLDQNKSGAVAYGGTQDGGSRQTTENKIEIPG